MNLEAYTAGEERKRLRRKEPLSSNKRHNLLYRKEFIDFCISSGVKDSEDIKDKIYTNFIRYLKDVKRNKPRTRLDKSYEVKRFLREVGSSVKPNPWGSYAKQNKKSR